MRQKVVCLGGCIKRGWLLKQRRASATSNRWKDHDPQPDRHPQPCKPGTFQHHRSDEPVTQDAIRSFIANDIHKEIDESEHMHHFYTVESLIDELDELIDKFGESAAAADFVYAFASV